ncbi:tetratricopeptide repeat protein [Terasakiella sp. SH-1]|uniref:tetratricopeptide repeat protein n=1 Tax=Terasakiella sp. SH-1 TaxID=2560057 RepID=UPI001073FEDB|nr:tetratricopeptide repeat protein [Terasakiella sp. SH-1]
MKYIFTLAVCLITLNACTTPSYVEEGKDDLSLNPLNEVHFKVYDSYKQSPPNCVAVLPLTNEHDNSEKASLSFDEGKAVRQAFYAHLAPQGKRDIELPRVDFLLNKLDEKDTDKLEAMKGVLNCDAIIRGKLVEFESQFFGVYSRVAVGAEMEMVRLSDGELLWKARHIAQSHGGGVSLSPIGLAMGILDAATNMEEEQTLRLIDDLSRRLVSTIPDDNIAVLDEPIVEEKIVLTRYKEETLSDFLNTLSDQETEAQIKTLEDALQTKRFPFGERQALHEQLVILDAKNPQRHNDFARYLAHAGDYSEAINVTQNSIALNPQDDQIHFLQGRLLSKTSQYPEALSAYLKASALNEKNAEYLNGIGYVNSLLGHPDKAFAAYQMALKQDPANGYAYYNMGVTLQNAGELNEAADAYYGAALAYIKQGRFGQAQKTLTDLNDLSTQGIDVSGEVQLINDAISALGKKET